MADDFDIYDEMQDLCAQAPGFKPRNLTNANNKWLVKSALQKAIRRGNVEAALAFGELVYATDPVYCWSGLAVMIVEDVGIGDPDLVAYSTQAVLKSVRDRMEPEMLYAGMIARACVADHSRACCEVSLGCDIQQDGLTKDGDEKPPWPVESNVPQQWRDAWKASDEEIYSAFAEGTILPQYIAANVLRKRLRNQGIDALTAALENIMHLTDDTAQARAAMLSFERTADSMSLAMWPVVAYLQMMASDDDPVRAVDDLFLPSVQVKTCPSEAFDMHTMQGNKASAAFHKILCEKDERFKLIPVGETKRPLGSMIFIVEGGQVSRRVTNEALEHLKWFQDYNFMLGYGVPPDIATVETLQIVADNIEILHEKRKFYAK